MCPLITDSRDLRAGDEEDNFLLTVAHETMLEAECAVRCAAEQPEPVRECHGLNLAVIGENTSCVGVGATGGVIVRVAGMLVAVDMGMLVGVADAAVAVVA